MAMNAVEFIAALEEIEASKGISKDTILDMLKESLIKAYRKLRQFNCCYFTKFFTRNRF